MGFSPAAAFVIGTLALAGSVGVLATQAKGAPREGSAGIPHDAESFGFAIRTTHAGVPLLEATRPFTLGLTNGPVHGRPPSTAHATAAAQLVARELDRYTPALLRKLRLAGVVFADDLTEGAMPIPSLPNVGGLLLLDVHGTDAELVRVLHHELFHFFDLADDGVVSPDPSWEALDPDGFLYGSGGRTLRGAWAARPTTEIPGVLSAYATSGVEEDKAETFSFAVTAPAFLDGRAAVDPAVKAKRAELVRRISAVDADAPARLGLAPRP